MALNSKRRVLIVFALLIAVVYVAAALATDARQVASAFGHLGAAGCLAVLGLSLTNYALRFFRWQNYLARLGYRLPALRHFAYYIAGFAFTVSPAKAGEAVRSLYLRDHGVGYADSIAGLFVERLLDLIVIVVLASLIVTNRPAFRPLIAGVVAVVLAALIIVCQPVLPRWLAQFAERRRGVVSSASRALAGLLRSARRLLHPVPLLGGFALGLLSWAAEGLGFDLVCRALDVSMTPVVAVGIYAVSVLAGSAAFFLPAGIGGTEVVMTTLLVQQNAPLRIAIVATILCRLATLWFAVLLGIAAAGGLEVVAHRRLKPVLRP